MTSLDARRWQDLLDEAVAQCGVPGAALALFAGGQTLELATGVLNVETQVPVTPDSVFQIGSVTKTYTATLVMQLVDEGRLELDQPITDLLPELDLGDPQANAVTMRQLLGHTSGIQGDHFVDTGRGDDAIARYVQACTGIGFSHPVGATTSYCNTGLILAGRIVEKLTGQTWDEALSERLLEPLGVQHTVTLPEQAIRHRVAHGHRVDSGATKLVDTWTLPRAAGPAGLICAAVGDVIAFARTHLSAGTSPAGKQVLSAAGAAAMQAAHVRLPDQWTLGSHWGLGWCLFDWAGRRVYGHDGNITGQAAYLRVVPDCETAVALVVNGGHAQDCYQAVFRPLLAELCRLDMPAGLQPSDPRPHVDVAKHAGSYARLGVRIELENRGGALIGRSIATGELAELDDEPIEEYELHPVSDSVFVTRDEGERTWTPFVFYALADGTPYLHTGARATPKVSS